MTALSLEEIEAGTARPPVTRIDDAIGTMGMVGFICTEAMLFLLLFFSYYYLSGGTWQFPGEKPPKLPLAFVMLGLLLASSIVLHLGEHAVKKGRQHLGRIALAVTIALGLSFVVVQGFEYHSRMQEILPQSSAYGSIFYVITSTHALHMLVGLGCLGYTLALWRFEPRTHAPHRPYHDASLYWHFVDVVWVIIVALLYVLPNIVSAP